VLSVVGAFTSFVVCVWVTGKINGYRRAETDVLHGAIVCLVVAPVLVVFAAVGRRHALRRLVRLPGWCAGLGQAERRRG
jgi:hypothetical protein